MHAATPASPFAPHHIPLAGLARALVHAGCLNEASAQAALYQAHADKRSLVAHLVTQGAMSAAALAHQIAHIFSLPLLDLDALDMARLPQGLLDPQLCATHQVLPLRQRGARILVATADPSDKEAAENIKFTTQFGVDWIVVEYDKLVRCIQVPHPAAVDTSVHLGAPEAMTFHDFKVNAPAEASALALRTEVEDTQVVKFLQKMLLDACHMQASDLHFEPYEHSYRVRFRIDGELREIASTPIAIKDRLASRIKVISRLDISEKRVPQDGRMKLQISPDRVVDFRVSTLPTLFGEKIVIRILDAKNAKMGIDALGYAAEDKKHLLHAIQRPYGMILVTGPTGSGKTVSLYSCLHLLNQPGVNISTVEDPSEIHMQGINQVNVNEKAGLTFAAALRSFLRQDPDVIMVGEIRDLETADIAIKAAQTGHLVLSTLHTNDAPTTLTRLRNMGIAPFNIASSVILITAQRLARRLCPQCKQPQEIPRDALLAAGYIQEQLTDAWTPYKPMGCTACHHGYKGRIGIYQVMPITEAIQRIILRDGSALELAAQAQREGVKSLRESGLEKVRQGVTSLEEVLAVTNL